MENLRKTERHVIDLTPTLATIQSFFSDIHSGAALVTNFEPLIKGYLERIVYGYIDTGKGINEFFSDWFIPPMAIEELSMVIHDSLLEQFAAVDIIKEDGYRSYIRIVSRRTAIFVKEEIHQLKREVVNNDGFLPRIMRSLHENNIDLDFGVDELRMEYENGDYIPERYRNLIPI